MPNANIIELETCLADCLHVFEQNPQAEYTKLYEEPTRKVMTRWNKAIDLSETHHIKWRQEEKEARIAYKSIALTLREVQRELRSIGAVDFPQSRVMYWDQELLLQAVDQMCTYLKEQKSDIDFADSYLERFDRLIGGATSETKEVDSTLKEFQRFVDMRRESLHEVAALIYDMRVGMRRMLGKKSDIYNQIRWPYAIASDENVLF